MNKSWRTWLAVVSICTPVLVSAAASGDLPTLDAEIRAAIANGSIDVITVQGASVYLGGEFTEVDGTPASAIARWNGSRWSALGSGIVVTPSTGEGIRAIVEYNGLVYAGGLFSIAGGTAVRNIARWDGQRWLAVGSSALANGGPASVSSMAVYQGKLHAAGRFEFDDGGPADSIAAWDGQRWSRVGAGIAIGSVSTLRVFRSELFASGDFTEAGGVPARNLARWNGSSWAALGAGVEVPIVRMEASESQLVAATLGGYNPTTLYRWDGDRLTTLPAPQSGFFSDLRDIATWGAYIYFEGSSWSPHGPRDYNSVRWNGTQWVSLHSGWQPPIGSSLLAMDAGAISVGGNDLRRSGAPQLISATTAGGMPNGFSTRGRVSSDGKRVVFISDASNLGAPTSGYAVYLRDRDLGSTTRPSDLVLALEPGLVQTFDSYPAISSDGSVIAMQGSSGQIYVVRNNRAELASRNASGIAGSAPSANPALSSDGRFMAFDSRAGNLIGDAGNGSVIDVFIKDLDAGTVELVSQGMSGVPANGHSEVPAINGDGSVVAFTTSATNLSAAGAANTSGAPQIMLASGAAGARRVVAVTRNLTTGELGNGRSSEVRLTARGRYGVFTSAASNLVSDDTNGVDDVFWFEFDGSAIVRLERVSVAHYGQQANGASTHPSVSDDGQTVVFDTAASNLVLVDRNGVRDVVRKRLSDGEVLRFAASADGLAPMLQSFDAQISGDGSGVVFSSLADNLVAGDSNARTDVFWAPGDPSSVDEPTLASLALPVPDPPFASCPGGYFIATIDDGAGSGLTAGLFGVAVQLLSGGSQRLEGGLNFGGLIDVAQEGFAGFNIQNPANEAQRVSLNLTGHLPYDRNTSLPVRIKVIRQPAAGVNEVVYERTATLSMTAPLVDSLIVQPGFHVVTVLPLTGDNRFDADGQIYVQLGTKFVDRIGGGFFGGVVVGGYHAVHPLGDVSGFAAFCLGSAHSASISTYAAPAYGSRGARDLRLRVLDYQRREIARAPAP